MASRLDAKSRVTIQKSQSVAQNVDPRAEKTRVLITTSFVALLSRRSYDRIRVSDITRKARVGRATFYAGPAAPEFAPRFVASTLLTLLAWSLEQPTAPAPTALQDTFRSLVGRALA
jgi:hypothetical protein